jgi:hypothetical protein
MNITDLNQFKEKTIVKLDSNNLEVTLEAKFNQNKAELEIQRVKLEQQAAEINANISKVKDLLKLFD